MLSLVAYIIPWFVWYRFKGSFQSPEALHARITKERKTLTHKPPPSLYRRVAIEERIQDGYPVYEVSPKSENPHKARILYLHGGAFVFEILDIHWNVAAELAEGLNAIVTVPIYPLGPEHKLGEMYDFLMPVQDDVARQAQRENVPFLMVGDSCGGSMALVLTQKALAAGKRMGKGIAERIVLTTPVVDSSCANPDMRAAAPKDPFHDMPGFEEILRTVCEGMDPKDPVVSPLYGDLSGLPPMLVFIAEKDLLCHDARKFVDMAKQEGREVEVVEGEGLIHVWPVMPFYEGGVARKQMIEWLSKSLE